MDKIDPILQHPRDQITAIIKRIYNAGMTTTSGGNISIIDSAGTIWVTPSAVDKGSLQRKDIMCVRKDGTVIGEHRPSSEFPFHRAIYEARSDIKAIIHAHPPALVSFSIVRQIPNTNIIPQARHVCGPIGYAEYALPGGEELGMKIARQFKDGYNAVIMENHGVAVGGSDLKDAYIRFETLEFSARTIIGAKTVGEPRYLTDEQIAEFDRQIPDDLPEMDRVEHEPCELSIRRDISLLVRRACDQGLMISSYGNMSVRWQGNDFLITPRNVPRWEMDLEDILQIRDGKREPGKLPSRSFKIHERIYREHTEVNSIIMTQSPNVMAFGVSHARLDVRTIPESWIFLQDIRFAEFGKQFTDDPAIPSMISSKSPAVIVENDAIIVTGDKLLQTFDRLEVAEFSAKSLVMGNPLGELVPINEQQIDALRKKFLE
ncbi:MAG TPA: class II aldolase/adducin family protein [Bacteroidaceae bacterium]|nr:class II aldolase/adducin family protein [Bacteroidaceae bacterium]